MQSQNRPVVPPVRTDGSLQDFAQIIQKNLTDLFQSAHTHKVITTAPLASDGSIGDIYIVDTGLTSYLTWKTKEGWQSSAVLFINVKDYGAVGDGATDDTQAIQAAINAAPALGIVYFPAGNYLISAAIKLSGLNDVTLFAYGAKWTLKGGSTTDLLTTANYPNAGGGARPRILGLTIDGNKASNPGAGSTAFYSVDAGYIKDCYFQDMDGVGYFLIQASNWKVENCIAKGCGASGFAAYNGSTNCSFVDCYGIGCAPNFLLEGPEVNGQSTSYDLSIIGGASINSMTGQDGIQVFIGVNRFRIIGVLSMGSAQHGINFQTNITGALSTAVVTQNGVISGCILLNNNGYGINIWDDASSGSAINEYIVISGNRIYDDQGSPTQTYGIALRSQTDHVTICDNDLTGNGTNGILNSASGTHNKIFDNRGYVTRNTGATSISDGGTINHGLALTPTAVIVSPTIAAQGASVTAVGSTNFTVALKAFAGGAGSTQTVYWQASAE